MKSNNDRNFLFLKISMFILAIIVSLLFLFLALGIWKYSKLKTLSSSDSDNIQIIIRETFSELDETDREELDYLDYQDYGGIEHNFSLWNGKNLGAFLIEYNNVFRLDKNGQISGIKTVLFPKYSFKISSWTHNLSRTSDYNVFNIFLKNVNVFEFTLIKN